MPLPVFSAIETPILHELAAVGGKDDVRFLYDRLIPYFPQLSNGEIAQIKGGQNQNWRKAVQKAARSLETNIFDFDGDLYGTRLSVGFVQRLRGEKKFDGIDALVSQIRRDVEAARAIHERR